MIFISIKKLWLLFIIHHIAAEQCVQKSPCECVNEDGFGYNLAALNTTEVLETYSFSSDLQYFFHPCSDILSVPSHFNATIDTPYSICVFNTTDKKCILQVSAKDAILKVNVNADVFLLYEDAKSNTTITITLACSNVERNDFLFVETTKNEFHLILYSKEACLKRLYTISTLSTGAMLNITLLITIFAYLTIGIAVNYFLMGARGMEVIPHLEFWKDFPFLVKDGVKFVQNGCKIQPSDLSENRDIYTSI